MNPEDEIKMHLHMAAATLTAGVMANLPDKYAVDPNIEDPENQQVHIHASRVHHVFFSFLTKAWDAWDGPKVKDAPLGKVGEVVKEVIKEKLPSPADLIGDVKKEE